MRPSHANAAHALLERLPADRVEDDVDTLAVRQGAHAIPQIVDRVVDRLVGAVLPGDRELLCAARSRDDTGAQELAHLDRRQADATGRAEHEQRFAGSKMPSM